ncbi:MAG: histidinol-phosphate transaminase [Chitinophagaceae bacterium]|nr:MAG: histidinol-phosphate transaminase [Chitinophagaceae bacterium]
MDLDKITRANIRKLKPYSSARDEFQGTAEVYLDANENSLGSPLTKWYNRYPDPHQVELKQIISQVKSVPPSQIFLGNGSDECIDLLYRSFCEPGRSNVIICPPTYGMYEVSAGINDIELREAPLTPAFQLDLPMIESLIDENTRLIWVCSPNNPTGNSMKYSDIEELLNNFSGLVVVDEAYINFSRQRSLTNELKDYDNLVVMQTFSKAWGLAGLRLGMAFASEAIIAVLNKVKPPYNINQATQDLAKKALQEIGQVNDMILEIVAMRDELANVFRELPLIEKVFPSDANFILAKVRNATDVYNYLVAQGIIVRNRSNIQWAGDCLRITVGTETENTRLVDALITFMKQFSTTPQSN